MAADWCVGNVEWNSHANVTDLPKGFEGNKFWYWGFPPSQIGQDGTFS